MFAAAHFDPLITDWLVYLLLFAILSFAVFARNKEHIKTPWRQVVRRRLAIGSLAVLSAFVMVGLADSVHFRVELDQVGDFDAGKRVSLLDRALLPLRMHQETTYSEPFALVSYQKETQNLPDGSTQRAYPTLKYVATHLQNPAVERWPDVKGRLLRAAGYTLACSLLLTWLVALTLAKAGNQPVSEAVKYLLQGKTEIPWIPLLLTLAVLLFLVFAAVLLAPHYHVFGTDKVGEDIFYQSLKSVRTGLVIGTLTTLVMLPAAVLLGIAAGYFRGWVDDLIQYLYTTLSSIPGILLIAASVLSLQVYMDQHGDRFDSETRADAHLLFLCMILGITSWTGLCRMLRGETLKLRELEYVQAAQSFGVRSFPILMHHILPNVMHIVLISIVLDFSGLVLAEAVLSYVGIGVDPTMKSWGNMINQARLELARDPVVWWSVSSAFVFMFTLVLSANLFADAVRDAFDPRLRK